MHTLTNLDADRRSSHKASEGSSFTLLICGADPHYVFQHHNNMMRSYDTHLQFLCCIKSLTVK